MQESGGRLDCPGGFADPCPMSTATIEQFQSNLASLLAAVELGEPILISRGTKPIARVLPVEVAEPLAVEREDWLRSVDQNLLRNSGQDEPDYLADQIIEHNSSYRP